MEPSRPKVGIVILLFKDGKLLLGKRKTKEGTAGMYGTCGGHLEHLETFEMCAKREAKEEADVEIENVEFVGVVNVREFAPLHMIMIILRADWKSGEVRNCEPDRHEDWGWFDLNALPSPMTPATEKGIQAFKTGQKLFE
jgi:8-oxo-dGTP diphosphatase